MKTVLSLIALMLFFVPQTFAQTLPFHNANQVTVGWNAVTQDVDGEPLTSTVFYKLWLVNADTDPEKNNAVEVWTGEELQATITLGIKGRYFVGVQAWLDEDLHSFINWADELEGQEEVTLFGLRFAVPPNRPKNLRMN